LPTVFLKIPPSVGSFMRKARTRKQRRRILYEALMRLEGIDPNPKWTAQYRVYLKSEGWRKFAAKIRADREKCERCGSTQSLQVHHLTYYRLGREHPQDVQLLCKSCHEDVHGRKFE